GVLQAHAQAAQAVIDKFRRLVAAGRILRAALIVGPARKAVLVVGKIDVMPAVGELEVAVVIVGKRAAGGTRRVGQLVLRIHFEIAGGAVVGTAIEIPGGVVIVATVLGVDGTVGDGELADFVIGV